MLHDGTAQTSPELKFRKMKMLRDPTMDGHVCAAGYPRRPMALRELLMAIPSPLLGDQDYAWAELCPILQVGSLVSSQSPFQPLVSSLCL